MWIFVFALTQSSLDQFEITVEHALLGKSQNCCMTLLLNNAYLDKNQEHFCPFQYFSLYTYHCVVGQPMFLLSRTQFEQKV